MANLTLDWNTTNECNWTLWYYVGTPIPFDPLTWTEAVPGVPVALPDDETVTIYAAPEDLCCFNCWESLELWERNCKDFVNPLTLGFVASDVEIHANMRRCDGNEPCTPRWKDIDTLLQKANCLCSWIGVEVVEDFCGSGYTAFVIYDRCQTSDVSLTGYHDIIAVYDPNYLLGIIECLCGQQKTSDDQDYIVSPVQP